MFNIKGLSGFLSMTALLSTMLHADGQAPLRVEELLSKKNTLNADVSVSYTNIDQKTALSTVVPVSTLLSYIYVPAYAGEQVIDQDVIVASLNLKYGLTNRIEAVLYADGHSTSSRIKLGTAIGHQSDTEFDHVGIGLTGRVVDEGNTPSLLIGATANAVGRVTFAERDSEGQVVGTKNEMKTFESFNFYALSYYTVDPIVFVLKATYQWSLEQDFENDTTDRPDIIAVSPQIYFAVNPYINLTWGITYQYVTEMRYNGEQETIAESMVGYSIGMSYEISRGNILTVDASSNDTTTYSQKTVNFIFSKRF